MLREYVKELRITLTLLLTHNMDIESLNSLSFEKNALEKSVEFPIEEFVKKLEKMNDNLGKLYFEDLVDKVAVKFDSQKLVAY